MTALQGSERLPIEEQLQDQILKKPSIDHGAKPVVNVSRYDRTRGSRRRRPNAPVALDSIAQCYRKLVQAPHL